MPFKDAAARREYIREYMREYVAGKLRTVTTGAKARKKRAAALLEKHRRWEIENHEHRMKKQRERRRNPSRFPASRLNVE